MAIPLAPAVVAVISVVGVGIFKVVEGDHDVPSFLIFSSPTSLPLPPRVTSGTASSKQRMYPGNDEGVSLG
jgi:hypothetical protein